MQQRSLRNQSPAVRKTRTRLRFRNIALACLLATLAGLGHPGFAQNSNPTAGADGPKRSPAIGPQTRGSAATRAKPDRSRRQNRLPANGGQVIDPANPNQSGDNNGSPDDSGKDDGESQGPQRKAFDPEEERRTRASIQAYIDPLIKDLMSELRIPGAAIAIVRRDRVYMLQGYGFGDLTGKARVDAIRTRFPVGRVSAALTAAAVLHAHDRGLLGLKAPADSYLEYPLPRPLGARLSVEDLLLRETGFAAVGENGGYAAPGLAPGLDEYLKRTRPAYRRRDSGPSDYEINLLGRILERQSRLSFAAHLEQFFFRPIGMNRSSFDYLNPQNAASNIPSGDSNATQTAADQNAPAGQARPYRYEPAAAAGGEGRYIQLPARYFAPAPALGLSTTAGDMARYLVMLLDGGRFGQARLLAKDSASRVLDLRDDDRFLRPSYRYGLEPLLADAQNSNTVRDAKSQSLVVSSRRALINRGDLPGYTAALLFAPDQEYGVFLAANSGSPQFRERVLQAFLKRFVFP